MSLNAFIDHYQKWCKRKKYNFRKSKAEEIYGKAKELVPVLPKDEITKRIIKQAVGQLNSASSTVEELRTLMNDTASKLPEYPIVMEMNGVGPSLGPQLMAEIGDVTRFTHKGAITAFAGVDPSVNESGTYSQKSVPTSKRGSADLRKTLFLVIDVLIKTMPQDEHYYICHDGRELHHIRTETKQQDGYVQTFEVYGCSDCSGCEHKAKCLYKYNAEKNHDKNKVMKINERWEDLKEETHANIQSEKGILNRQIRSIQTEVHFGDIKENEDF